MSAVDTLIAFIGAWLTVGVGFFFAMRSFGSIRAAPAVVMPLLAATGLVGLAFIAIGLTVFVRVTPW